MSVNKHGNRWRAIVKAGRQYAGSKVFDTRREAETWERRQKALLSGSPDPRAGQQRIGVLLDLWAADRPARVAVTTARAETALLKWVSPALRAVKANAVSAALIEAEFTRLAQAGKARASIARFRNVLGSFFSSLVRDGVIPVSPVRGVRIPTAARATEEVRPYSEAELMARLTIWRALSPIDADTVAFLGMTALRWSEARALRAGDLVEVPTPAIRVERAQPEGTAEPKTPKSGKARRVPLEDAALDIARKWAAGKAPSDRLLPRVHAGGLRLRLDWGNTSQGRTLHDLRHTAITHWLIAGVDVQSVRQWAGHSDLSITSRYAHWVGGDADAAALDRLNRARGAHRGHTEERKEESRDAQ
ncbi:tyrosine-type recombinase/integrase [Microbacterium phosphatis]|uniref:tyrosine-type recombinase/integrase n=1 Tax=Microbacterium phosphatis TaxID=3140248 RepID=UPI0031401470